MTEPTQALPRPVRAFLSTEAASTSLLLAATVVALLWVNLPFGHTYDMVWHTPLAISLGDFTLRLDLQHWINDGLMAIFFFVIGMEVSREFVRGEMRDRRKAAVPMIAALGGLAIPALVYLAFNAGGPAMGGWGIPMATDTAFVLGVLRLVGPRCPDPLRTFLLTLAVADDIGAILVVAVAYTRDINVYALVAALALFGVIFVMRRFRIWRAPLYALVAAGIWLATLQAGVHPTVVGIVLGVLVQAYSPADKHVLRAGELVQEFTYQPTPERGRAAALGVRAAVPANERLQLLLHPWTSYVIVPLFALANAGIPLSPEILNRSLTSSVTLGIVAGLVVGKLIGVCLGSWIGLRARLGILPGNLVWGQLTGGAALAGIGFTISLFISDLAFTDEGTRVEAKVGILCGSLIAAALGWTIFRLAWHRGAVCAPPPAPGEPEPEELPDTLAEPVSEDDHVRGGDDAAVTIVEYGDYECPGCGAMYPVLDALQERYGDQLRFAFRHYPVTSLHPQAWRAALAAEAAGPYGRFWEMHDQLFTHQRHLDAGSLASYAERIGVPRDEVTTPEARAYADRVDADLESARASGVRGTPTFFVNGWRYDGRHDFASLAAAIDAAAQSR